MLLSHVIVLLNVVCIILTLKKKLYVGYGLVTLSINSVILMLSDY